MNWTHISRVQTEGDNHVMEDACGYRGNAVWMIDGATSLLDELDLPGESNPSWYAQILNLALAECAGAADPREVLAAALAKVDALGDQLVGAESQRFPSAAVSLVTADGDARLQVLSLADCHVVAALNAGGVRHVGEAIREPSATVDDLRTARLQRNTPGGVWVARREPAAAYQARVVNVEPAHTVALASDGAWRAVDLGLVSGPEEFLEAVRTPVGAQELMLTLRSTQDEIGESADDASVLCVMVD
ncbi:SpoIIE family protein phosphatase [Arthrobacter sp. H5]|uniref:SpoIIE family protein phosphatase n=1 Tax=Arthrobacter sp. H5 TaxID=1267973 RepID=UPI000488085B|nr:SpoIIE family protein phosphatase [Arthrobacter sp. H5]